MLLISKKINLIKGIQMKRIVAFIVVILFTVSAFAQAPEKMTYQVVIRDSQNKLVKNQSIGMRISVLQGSSSGTAVYVETQNQVSNSNGLVSFEIGSGTVVSGSFSAIDWGNGPFYIKSEADLTGGTSYTIVGTTQLLSVPYALYAKNSGSISKDSITSIINNIVKDSAISGNDLTTTSPVITITNGNGAVLLNAKIGLDTNKLAHLLTISPMADSLAKVITTNNTVVDSIKSIVNNLVTSDSIKGNDLTAGSNKIVITGGTGATLINTSVDVDETKLTLANQIAGGTSGQVLTSNGSGVASWQTPTAYTVSNGLTLSTNDIQLGGSLTKNTTIAQGAYTLGFTTSATNGFSVDGTTFSVDGANNRVGIGTVSPAQTLSVLGNIGISDSTYYTAFNMGTQSANISYTLPTAQATASGQVLTNNGSGVLSWASNGGLKWYAEDSAAPTTAPIVTTGTGSIAIGNGTRALSNNMFVVGYEAGKGATNASYSSFLGYKAGSQAINANYSNFLGYNAGHEDTNASYSNFIGDQAGYQATNASNSNFLGYGSGYQATNAQYSNFLGNGAGWQATNARNSNFLGAGSGYQATNAQYSNFLGDGAGNQAPNASFSNFLGYYAGHEDTNASYSNFIGFQAGYQATNATYSNFLGYLTGYQDTNANSSNFIGFKAGYQATNASSSNFLGYYAGYQATNAFYSNFIGIQAGYQATNARNSNFLGNYAGTEAANANFSNFLGNYAGRYATNAAYSNLFGYATGSAFSGDTIGSNNIIIGTNISLPNAAANQMNLGGVLFGTGFYNTTTGDPSITPVSGGKIGIGIVNPTQTLTVRGNIGITDNTHYTAFNMGTQTTDIDYTLPTAQATASGQVLTNDGSGVLSWTTPSADVNTIGTLNGQSKVANGAVILGSSLYMQTADATYPGLVSTGAQTLAGAKTFADSITLAGGKSLTFTGSTSGTVTVTPAASTTAYSLTLPAAKATTAGQVLSSDTNGVLSWATTNTMSINTISSATTLNATHYTVLCDANSAGFTVTLPAASTCTGRIYRLIKKDVTSNTITLSIAISIPGSASTITTFNVPGEVLLIQSDGTNWYKIN